jgi:ABC-type branched-subunit amino acid transport system ATPase component
MMRNVLEVKNLSVAYGKVEAVSNVSLPLARARSSP